MKTSVMEVRDMLSVLSVVGVEKRICEVPGVESVTVNYAAGSATVRYDETRLKIADIHSDVRQSGYESAVSPGAPSGSGHGAQPPTGATGVPKTPPAAAGAVSAGSAQLDNAPPAGAVPASSAASSSAAPAPKPSAAKAAPDAAAKGSVPAGDGQKETAAPSKS